MKKTAYKRYFSIILILFFAVAFLGASPVFAQNMTYTIEKGDTLWDICEKYYGDPDLWPKLWQMNPFVTNPHLLIPGDIITLWKKEPAVEVVSAVVEKAVVEIVMPEPEPGVMGVNAGELTDLRTLGYLSSTETEAWGTIFASDTGKLLFDKGDNAFVIFNPSKEINVGDQFSICKASTLIKHPISGEETGYVLTVLGRMTIEEPAGLILKDKVVDGIVMMMEEKELVEKKNVYRAKITEVYQPIYVDSIVTSFNGTILPCVLPKYLDQDLLGNIVASKEERQLSGQHSVVYINLGFNNGLNRGNLLEVVKKNVVKNPDLSDKKSRLDPKGPLFLPDVPIGTILVLETRPDSATGLVVSAKEEIGIGNYVKNLSREDTQEILKSLADCPIE